MTTLSIGFPFLDPRLHAQVLVLLERIEDVNDFEFFGLRPVDGGLIGQIIERHNRVVAQERHDLDDPVFLHFDLVLANEANRL